MVRLGYMRIAIERNLMMERIFGLLISYRTSQDSHIRNRMEY